VRDAAIRDRLKSHGIRRLGSPRAGFRYRHAGGRAVSRADLERIRGLRVPPAWRDVSIAPSPRERVQAIGLDAAGRWQYRYGAAHTDRRARDKFARLVEFGARLPDLRRALRRDLARPGLPLEKVQALSLLLLSACALRAGAEEYARDHGTFGLATLRPRHVEIRGDLVRLRFRGKHGVFQDQAIRSRPIARLLRAMKRLAGHELLKYRDHEGQVRDIRRHHLNDYIKSVMGRRFTARDFRTWAGTLLCAAALRRAVGIDARGRGRERAIVQAVKDTAARLGNTPAVVRQSYVHPGLLTAFRCGQFVGHGLENPEAYLAHRTHGLAQAERALLSLLRRNPPGAPAARPLLTLLRESRRQVRRTTRRRTGTD
jgi:DNA topoisomerase I